MVTSPPQRLMSAALRGRREAPHVSAANNQPIRSERPAPDRTLYIIVN